MATFWEIAAYSVYRVFSLLCLFVALVVSHLVSRVGSWFLLRLVLAHTFHLLHLHSNV